MPAASSSPIDPAIGQLIAAGCLDEEAGRLLPVLAAVLAGARSLTAIAEWAADADQATRDALGVTAVVPQRVHVPANSAGPGC